MIEIIRGDSHRIKVSFKEADGTAYDITDGKVFFTVTKETSPDNDDNAVIALSDSDPQITITNATEGLAEVQLTPDDTEQNPGDYYYDAQLVDAIGNVVSRDREVLKINPDITRRTS